MKNSQKEKVMLVSSTGGHFAQLRQIADSLEMEFVVLTEKNETVKGLESSYKMNYLFQQDRKKKAFIFLFALNILLTLKVFFSVNPKVIISTGAGAVLPALILGKLFKRKIIFIESFAKVNSPTVTGKIVYKFADKFYVQWEEMKRHYPNAEYRGPIY
jgi:beta-1,4-N-acetylglucosaminyltransferase